MPPNFRFPPRRRVGPLYTSGRDLQPGHVDGPENWDDLSLGRNAPFAHQGRFSVSGPADPLTIAPEYAEHPDAARWWEQPKRRYRRIYRHVCPECGEQFRGTQRQVFCSPRCRQRKFRSRHPVRVAARRAAYKERERRRREQRRELAVSPVLPLQARIRQLFERYPSRPLSTLVLATALSEPEPAIEAALAGMRDVRASGTGSDRQGRTSTLWVRRPG